MDNILDVYKIFTKDDYMRYRLSDMKAECISDKYINIINESWDKIRNGYNFVLGVGREDSLMFYSVEGFNEKILG